MVLEDAEVISALVTDTTFDPLAVCREVVGKASFDRIAVTGYGRRLFAEHWPEAEALSEIKAATIGAAKVHPGCRTVVDIGGQDTKAVALDEGGRMSKFAMNDRCAAGTGRFLEVMASALSFSAEEFVAAALGADRSHKLSSMCTVFAESEVISLVARGVPRTEIARGIHESIASRTAGLARTVPIEDDVLFVGGGALNGALRSMLEAAMGRPVAVPKQPQIVAALGAAIHAESS